MFEREPIYTEDVRLLERVSKLVGRSWICRALRFGELMVEIEKKIIEYKSQLFIEKMRKIVISVRSAARTASPSFSNSTRT